MSSPDIPQNASFNDPLSLSARGRVSEGVPLDGALFESLLRIEDDDEENSSQKTTSSIDSFLSTPVLDLPVIMALMEMSLPVQVGTVASNAALSERENGQGTLTLGPPPLDLQNAVSRPWNGFLRPRLAPSCASESNFESIDADKTLSSVKVMGIETHIAPSIPRFAPQPAEMLQLHDESMMQESSPSSATGSDEPAQADPVRVTGSAAVRVQGAILTEEEASVLCEQVSSALKRLVSEVLIPSLEVNDSMAPAESIAVIFPVPSKTLLIALKPAEFGHVEVRMTMRDGILNLRLLFERSDAAAKLRAHSQDLEQALRSAGLPVTAVLMIDGARLGPSINLSRRSVSDESADDASKGDSDRDRRREESRKSQTSSFVDQRRTGNIFI